MIEEHIGAIILGSSGVILTTLITSIRSLVNRIKKLEEHQLRMQGEIDLNTALDNERKK